LALDFLFAVNFDFFKGEFALADCAAEATLETAEVVAASATSGVATAGVLLGTAGVGQAELVTLETFDSVDSAEDEGT
jgi:hypothetical protein